MSNRFLGFLLVFIGGFIALPALFKLLFRFLFIAAGFVMIYFGLQKLEAHQILFHIDRFIGRFTNLFG